jgi:2,3-diaminopropionate biosynthesis protein SbnB
VTTLDFSVVPGSAVEEILADGITDVYRIVADTYRRHERGETVNPDSHFLRFPDRPDARVIALPASLGGGSGAMGIKWISSFPDNVATGLPRASAVLILNDDATGYPVACLEAAGISAARTAASATLALATLAGRDARRFAFVGAGTIARSIVDHMVAAKVAFRSVSCVDVDPAAADSLVTHIASCVDAPVTRAATIAGVLDADVVVFATTATVPHVPVTATLRPGQLVLHISLRDLPPQLLLAANNIVDDVEHCLKANTSAHLTEQTTGNRDFITGTIGAALDGRVRLDPGRATIFSPFGLGVLDIAVGAYVLEEARRRGTALSIPHFFGRTRRW